MTLGDMPQAVLQPDVTQMIKMVSSKGKIMPRSRARTSRRRQTLRTRKEDNREQSIDLTLLSPGIAAHVLEIDLSQTPHREGKPVIPRALLDTTNYAPIRDIQQNGDVIALEYDSEHDALAAATVMPWDKIRQNNMVVTLVGDKTGRREIVRGDQEPPYTPTILFKGSSEGPAAVTPGHHGRIQDLLLEMANDEGDMMIAVDHLERVDWVRQEIAARNAVCATMRLAAQTDEESDGGKEAAADIFIYKHKPRYYGDMPARTVRLLSPAETAFEHDAHVLVTADATVYCWLGRTLVLYAEEWKDDLSPSVFRLFWKRSSGSEPAMDAPSCDIVGEVVMSRQPQDGEDTPSDEPILDMLRRMRPVGPSSPPTIPPFLTPPGCDLSIALIYEEPA